MELKHIRGETHCQTNMPFPEGPGRPSRPLRMRLPRLAASKLDRTKKYETNTRTRLLASGQSNDDDDINDGDDDDDFVNDDDDDSDIVNDDDGDSDIVNDDDDDSDIVNDDDGDSDIVNDDDGDDNGGGNGNYDGDTFNEGDDGVVILILIETSCNRR